MLDNKLLECTRNFISGIKNKKNNIDIPLIESAIIYVQKYHKYQKRHSGEPYFSHILAVASITADHFYDTDSIVSALLHDVVEDTKSSIQEIEFLFGKNIAKIVDAVSKITLGHQLSKDETFHKLNSFDDIKKKAIIIKVIDRLHNMRTIDNIKSIKKQQRIASETLKFYIPLAKAANLSSMEKELNNIVLRIMNL